MKYTIRINGNEVATISGVEGAYSIYTELRDLLEGISTVTFEMADN